MGIIYDVYVKHVSIDEFMKKQTKEKENKSISSANKNKDSSNESNTKKKQ